MQYEKYECATTQGSAHIIFQHFQWIHHIGQIKCLLGECSLTVICYVRLCALLAVMIPTIGNCTEFNYFKLTDIEGAMKLGYSLTEREVKQLVGNDSYERRPAMEQELTVNTRSYVFHPNLLEMELGAGVRFQQEELENNQITNKKESTFYDFSGSFNILKNKPYPIRLYYTQSNPTQQVGVADALNVETQNYGMTISLRQPLIKTPIIFRADHSESSGENSNTIVDDVIDALSLSLTTNIADDGTGQLGINKVIQKSGSGSKDLFLQESESDTESIDWNSRVVLGDERDVRIFSNILLMKNDQSVATDRKQVNFNNHINWQIDDSNDAYNTYNYSGMNYGDAETITQNVIVGWSQLAEDSLNFNAAIEAAKEKSYEFDKSSYAINAGATLQSEINDRWMSSFGYAVLYRINSQISTQVFNTIVDESHVLNGLNFVSLDKEYVASGSITVSNQAHTQIYIENLDYVIKFVGSETRIERLITGNIADGETVLITYDFETGGTFDFDEFNQSVNIRYSLDRRYNFYIFYSTDKQKLDAGIPTRPLQSVQRYRLGMDAQLPINNTMDYGWEIELERRVDELHPFSRAALDLNWNAALPIFASFLRVGSGYEYIDNELTTEDLKETYLSSVLSARPGMGSTANLTWTYRRDDGRDIPKTTNEMMFGYSWSKGRLAFTVLGKRTREVQGDTSRTYALVEASLRRLFR